MITPERLAEIDELTDEDCLDLVETSEMRALLEASRTLVEVSEFARRHGHAPAIDHPVWRRVWAAVGAFVAVLAFVGSASAGWRDPVGLLPPAPGPVVRPSVPVPPVPVTRPDVPVVVWAVVEDVPARDRIVVEPSCWLKGARVSMPRDGCATASQARPDWIAAVTDAASRPVTPCNPYSGCGLAPGQVVVAARAPLPCNPYVAGSPCAPVAPPGALIVNPARPSVPCSTFRPDHCAPGEVPVS